jgi:hypothetical protein
LLSTYDAEIAFRILAPHFRGRQGEGRSIRCPFRKSYPDVLMVQSSQDRNGGNVARSLDRSMQRHGAVSPKNQETLDKSGDPKNAEEINREAAGRPPEPGAIDRPGFDLGGSTGDTNAGTGLGLGDDAGENRLDRSLPGRRTRGKLSIPRWPRESPATAEEIIVDRPVEAMKNWRNDPTQLPVHGSHHPPRQS